MKNQIANLVVRLGADQATFNKDFKNARKNLTGFTSDANKAIDVSKSVATSVGVAAAGMATLGYAIKSSLDGIDELVIAADNLSIPVENFGNLSYAAKLAKTDIDSVADVIKDISVKVQDAAFSGGGTLADFFDQINQDANEWAKLRPDEQFEKFVEEINKMDANQARFWLDEINDSASSMFSTLYGSGATFREFVKEAESVGIAIDQNMAGNARAARVEFDRLLALSGNTWTNIVGSASPAIEYVLSGINSWVIESAKADGGFQELGKNLTITMLGASQDITHSVIDMFDTIIGEARDIGKALGKDWFEVPNAKSLQLTLESTHKAMTDLQNNGQWVEGIGDVPGYWEMSTEQIKKYNELQVRAAELQKQLRGETDLSAFDAEIDKIITKVKEGGSSTASSVTAPIKPSIPLPTSSPTSDEKSGASALSGLDNAYANDAQRLALSHEKRLEQIESMTLSEQELRRRGFDSIEALRNTYAERENTFFIEQKNKLKSDRENALLGELALDENFGLTKAEIEEKAYANRHSMLEQALADKLITTERMQQLEADLFLQHQQKLTDIQLKEDEERAKESEKLAKADKKAKQEQSEFYGDLANTMGDYYSDIGGSQSKYVDTALGLGSTLLDEEKQNAISSVWTNTYDAAMAAYNALAGIPYIGPALGATAASVVVAAGGMYAGKLAGMAHDGIDNIPSEGTWLLDKGERVVDSRTNADLKNYLANSNGSSGGVVVNLIEDASRAGTVDQSSDGDTVTLDIKVAKLLQSPTSQTSAVMQTRYRNQQYGT